MRVQTDNRVRQFCFSGPHIEAKMVEQVRDYPVTPQTIVINPQPSQAWIRESPRQCLPPLSSTLLRNTCIEQAARVLLFEIKETANIGDIIWEPDWKRYGDLLPANTNNGLSFPRNTPLWRSAQDMAGSVEFDPVAIFHQETPLHKKGIFQVKVNLWFAPAQTRCFIHNQHNFIEIHSQIYGNGRIQKFKAQQYETRYEDILMSPGYTASPPFCRVHDDGRFEYPWHQYYADTDCIWLALEYHPL